MEREAESEKWERLSLPAQSQATGESESRGTDQYRADLRLFDDYSSRAGLIHFRTSGNMKGVETLALLRS